MASRAHRELWRLGPDIADFNVGWTREEWQRERWKIEQRKNRKDDEGKITDATRAKLVKLALKLSENGSITKAEACRITGWSAAHISTSLVSAEKTGLLLWDDDSIIGAVNPREWLQKQGVKEYA